MKIIKQAIFLLIITPVFLMMLSAVTNQSIVGKWAVVMSEEAKQKNELMYKEQLLSIDTMTVFPQEVIEMKAELAAMTEAQRLEVPVDMIELISIKDIAEFKSKMKIQIMNSKKSEDSLNQNRKIIYNFRKDNVVEIYTTDNLSVMDTSTAFQVDLTKQKVKLYMNPNNAIVENVKDTIVLKILHLSADRLSMKFDDAQNMEINNAPMDFVKYKE